MENTDLKATLMQEDEVIAQQAAIAVGDEGLKVLSTHFMTNRMFFEAAKLKWTAAPMKSLFSAAGVTQMEDALSLLGQTGKQRASTDVQALELRILLSLGWAMDKTNPNMHDIRRRITELRKGNPALPVEEWGIASRGSRGSCTCST